MGNRIPLEKRIESFVERVPFSGCWIWTGSLFWTGYGQITIDGYPHTAHRTVYEHFVGKIPQGMWIDHLCRVRCCVNPQHLEPVLPRENTLRGETLARKNFEKTHCKNGHILAGENLYMRPDGARGCRACKSEAKRNAASTPEGRSILAAKQKARRNRRISNHDQQNCPHADARRRWYHRRRKSAYGRDFAKVDRRSDAHRSH